jgi:hypothetical protein
MAILWPLIFTALLLYMEDGDLQSSGCKFSKKQETMKVMSHLCEALFGCKYFMFMVRTRIQTQHTTPPPALFSPSTLAHGARAVHRWVLLKFYGLLTLLFELARFNLETSMIEMWAGLIGFEATRSQLQKLKQYNFSTDNFI